MSIFDINKVCRTCLSIGELISLYDRTSTDVGLIDMLTLCTSVKNFENNLPAKICHDCVGDLKRSYNFAMKCKGSDEKLQIYLQNKTIEESNLFRDEVDEENQNNENACSYLSEIDYKTDNSSNDSLVSIRIRSDLCDPATTVCPFENTQNVIEVKHETLNDPQTVQNDPDEGFNWLKSEVLEQSDLIVDDIRAMTDLAVEIKLENESDIKNLMDPLEISIMSAEQEPLQRNESTTLSSMLASPKCEESNDTTSETNSLHNEIIQIDDDDDDSSKPPIISPEFFRAVVILERCDSKVMPSTRSSGRIIPQNKVQCVICEKYLQSKRALENHMKIHMRIRPACTICNRLFSTKNQLARHMVIHAKANIYPCMFCERKFKYYHYFNTHMLKHSAELRQSYAKKCTKIQSHNKEEVVVDQAEHSNTKNCEPANNNAADQIEQSSIEERQEILSNNQVAYNNENCQSETSNNDQSTLPSYESSETEPPRNEGESNHTNYQHNNRESMHSNPENDPYGPSTSSGHTSNHFDNDRHTNLLNNQSNQSNVEAERNTETAPRKLKNIDECITELLITYQKTWGTPAEQAKPTTVPKRQKCIVCNYPFRETAALNEHMKVHRGDRPFTCSFCGKVFSLPRGLKIHMLSHDAGKPFACSKCDLRFANVSNLRTHEITHSEFKKYHCESCNKSFHLWSSYKSHLSYHAGLKPYACEICHKTTSSKHGMESHRRTHYNDKPYHCPICSRSFIRKEQVTQHLRVHSREGFVCFVCGRKFTFRGNFKSHMKTHTTSEKPIVCKVCDNTFNTKDDLKQHMKAEHPTETPIKCGICTRTFKDNANLRQHMRVMHSAEKLYQCTMCDKSYRKIRLLKKHTQTHSTEYPFSCLRCGKSFKTDVKLCSHVRKFHFDKRFTCTFCNRKFLFKNSLQCHIERKHMGCE